MNSRAIVRGFFALGMALLLFVTGCAEQAPSRWDQAQQQSTQQKSGQAVSKKAEAGGSFNKFFPKPSEGFERVYTQEKKGFAEAKLKKGGKDVAMLSISDTISVPASAEKYKQSTRTISGYPAVDQGQTATGVLVAERYQVKVLSRDPSFTKSDRETWISKFDLNGLSRLK
ncbi:hypothetical protein BST81_23325 [Leptolyngbya sp. 'hensonii']|uniref:hypothetical protein n=1 Tax=Leptolyngbya sp. 'hensonii' TaxID=1922337 RepID=UPI00094FA0D4|nr:hypothetical protein [Leptolyngbya sp. 'hensonii']OLP15994.1 hypothetical protein BST81_23325 [Leptolyngbya sp. 'hensonii']